MTDVNAMCEEFIGLSFHGLRAKDKSFNASMEKHFDSAAGNVSVNKQDVGRVLLNLLPTHSMPLMKNNKTTGRLHATGYGNNKTETPTALK